MNKQDIRNYYTQKVTELLAQGYSIYPDTMRGSQGEIAHIDLSNGSEIIRVLLERNRSYEDAYWGDVLTITVGTAEADFWAGHWDGTIWNNKLNVRSQIHFGEITPDHYVIMDEAIKIQAKRKSRWLAKPVAMLRQNRREPLSDAYKSIALRWLRRQPRMKTAKLEDIKRFDRVITPDGKRFFEINVRGKKFQLGA